jgi:hypothetical protein
VDDFLEVLGSSIGFSPSFHTLSTMLSWLESFIPGMKKTGNVLLLLLLFLVFCVCG